MRKLGTIAALAALTVTLGTAPAWADSCSGKSHPTGTILGAVGGGLIGSAASHGNAGGVVAGAVLGGLAGNAIERSNDCRRVRVAHYYYDQAGHRHIRYTYEYRR